MLMLKASIDGVCIDNSNDRNCTFTTKDNYYMSVTSRKSLKAKYIILGPPTITSVSNDTTAVEGSKVSLICNATNDVDALDDVKIVWLQKISKDLKKIIRTSDNVLIYNKTDSSVGKVHSVLLFDPVNHTDDGEYICRALNHHLSYTEENTCLKVKCKLMHHVSTLWWR